MLRMGITSIYGINETENSIPEQSISFTGSSVKFSVAATHVKNETYYKKNAEKYKQKLTKLQTLIAKIKKNSDNKEVAVSEPVFDYALKDMGYKIANRHFAKATEDGSDPSYSDIKKLQNDIKHKKIAFFVENTQSDSKVISSIVSLCQKYDVPVIKVTETTPKGKDYLQWMSSEYEQVLKIQEDGK